MNIFTYMKISPGDLIRWLGAGIATAATFLFGGADRWLISLIAIVAIDYISGVVAAFINHEVNSKKGSAGIFKKVLFFCVVAVSNIIDEATGAGGVLRSLTIGFLLANESISILENCGRCGIPLPKRLLETLEQLKNNTNGGGNNGSKSE